MEFQPSFTPTSQNESRRKDLIIWWSIAGGLLALYFLIGLLEVTGGVYLPYVDQLSIVLFTSGVLIAIIAFVKTILAFGIKGRIIAVLIAFVVIGAGFVYVAYFLRAQKELGKAFEAFIPQQLELDETADWKTYRNEKYGFELKYPPGWENLSSHGVDEIIEIRKQNHEFGDFSLIIHVIESILNEQQRFQWLEDTNMFSADYVHGNDYEPFTVGGYIVYPRIHYRPKGGGIPSEEVSILTSKGMFVFTCLVSFEGYPDYSKYKRSGECDKTLKTFKFIDGDAAATSLQVSPTQQSTGNEEQLAYPSITIISPLGGEAWKVGTEQLIMWSPNGIMPLSARQQLKIYEESNPSNQITVSGLSAGVINFKWLVNAEPNRYYRVRVNVISHDGIIQNYGISSAPFLVVP